MHALIAQLEDGDGLQQFIGLDGQALCGGRDFFDQRRILLGGLDRKSTRLNSSHAK